MQKAYINPSKCDASPFCAAKRACPVKAISQEKTGMFSAGTPVVSKEACVGCKKCLSYCPHDAIVMKSN